MAFEQRKLDRSIIQTRGIFNKYVYETDDTVDEVQATDYFAESRFIAIDGPQTNGMGWVGGLVECQCSDGYFIGQVQPGEGSIVQIFQANVLETSDHFNSLASRDVYYSDPLRFSSLRTGDPVLVNIGPDTVSAYTWTGQSFPVEYNSALWVKSMIDPAVNEAQIFSEAVFRRSVLVSMSAILSQTCLLNNRLEEAFETGIEETDE